jgi:hypothetical protein
MITLESVFDDDFDAVDIKPSIQMWLDKVHDGKYPPGRYGDHSNLYFSNALIWNELSNAIKKSGIEALRIPIGSADLLKDRCIVAVSRNGYGPYIIRFGQLKEVITIGLVPKICGDVIGKSVEDRYPAIQVQYQYGPGKNKKTNYEELIRIMEKGLKHTTDLYALPSEYIEFFKDSLQVG